MHKLLPYQIDWIKDNSRIKLMEKSRQIGISWATAYALVAEHAQASTKHDSWVSSRDETQARLFLQDCSKFSSAINSAAISYGSPILHNSDKPTKSAIHFANNTSIHCLSSNPNAQAGKRGSRILDEFALHPDPELLYSIAYPGITWGGNLQIISTHRSHNNFFNKLVQEIKHGGNPKNISLHTVTLENALDQGFLDRLKLKLPHNDPIQSLDNAAYFDFIKAACPDEEAFLQEYMCTPTDESTFFLSPSLLDNAIIHPSPLRDIQSLHNIQNPLYLGVDLARSKDLSVFIIIEKTPDAYIIRSINALKNVPFDAQTDLFNQLLDIPNLQHASIDQSGLGLQFTETAIQKFSAERVHGIQFTLKSKEDLAYRLKSTLDSQKIKIPNQKTLLHDLRAIKRSHTQHGNITFDAPRTKHGHADRFWALTLALHAASYDAPPAPTAYHNFKNNNNSNNNHNDIKIYT